jgi:hypothetical protein
MDYRSLFLSFSFEGSATIKEIAQMIRDSKLDPQVEVIFFALCYKLYEQELRLKRFEAFRELYSKSCADQVESSKMRSIIEAYDMIRDS